MASEIKVNTIKDLGGNTVLTSNGSGTISGLPASAISSGTVATARLGSGTASSSTFLAGDSSYKTVSVPTLRPNATPLIINGDMAISQRSISVTGIGNGDEGYHTIDRFKFEEGQTPTAVWTMTQESLTSGNAYNAGFTKALKMDCTTSDNASGHADILNVMKYATERQDTHLFKKGTSSAEKYTVAFWFKATKTGTHICELRDSTNDRAVSVAYTVSSSNTWEHKVLVFPADTTGAIGTGNSKGLEIYWCLYSGSGYQSGSLQTAWGSSASNKRYTGQVNNADSTSNNWHITGLQLEVGEYSATNLPPFQHESFGNNLARCQRYFQTIADGSWSNVESIAIGYFHTSSRFIFVVRPTVEMRSNPSLTTTMGTNYVNIYRDDGEDNSDNIETYVNVTKRAITMTCNDNVSGTKGQGGWVMLNNASAFVGANSEL